MGSLDATSGKFTLHASLRFSESDVAVGVWTMELELEAWRRSFQRASELLYYATDGQHQLGTIWVWPDKAFGNVADLWLEQASNTEQSNSTNARIYWPGTHVTLYDERRHPFTILHELGHYLYGLRDEYDNDDSTVGCIGRDGAGKLPGACIMEGRAADGDSYTADSGGSLVHGDVTDFCVACNHDKGAAGATCAGGFTSFDNTANDTVQSLDHGQSCWETMIDRYASLSLPGVLPMPTEGPDEVDWNVGVKEIRCTYALDLSREFWIHFPHAAQAGRDAAFALADLLPDGTKTGFVAYSDIAQALPISATLHRLDAPFRSRVRAFYNSIPPGPGSAMGEGLLAALSMFLAEGNRATTQFIMLVSGSQTDMGFEPLLLVPILRNRGIRVLGFGVGPHADMDRIIALSEATGGAWWRIPHTPRNSLYPFRSVESAVGELVAEILDGGIISNGDVGEDWQAGLPLPFGGDNEFFVEEGAEELRIAAYPRRGQSAVLKVTSPDGKVVQRRADAEGPRRPLVVDVRKPESGSWRVDLPRSDEDTPVPWNACARSVEVGLSVTVRAARVPAGTEVPIRVQLTARHRVTGLRIRMDVVGPEGRITALEAPLEDEREPGVYVAAFTPEAEGAYTVRARVDSRHGARFCPPSDCGTPATSEPPRVVRHAERSFFAGPRVTGEARLRPNALKRGRHRVALHLGGIPWVPGFSSVALGPGVRVIELPGVPRDDTVTLLVEVTDAAAPGLRDAVVVTGSQRQQLDGAVTLDVPDPAEIEGKAERAVRPGHYLAGIFDKPYER